MKEDYNTIAGYFVDVPDIEVARINISKNDVSNLEMRSNPMIALYKAGGNGREMVVMEKVPNLGVREAGRSEG